MEQEKKSIKQNAKNRVTLTNGCVTRLGRWETQINERFKGMQVKPTDLVEWAIASHPDTLTVNELRDIQSIYWDDIAMASWALREMKKARATGGSLSLQEVLTQNNVASPRAPVTSRRKGNAENNAAINNLVKEEPDVKTEV